MPQTFEFIEVKPSNTDVSENRQKIRSKAARSGSLTDRLSSSRESSQKGRRKRNVFWPLAVRPKSVAERDDVEQTHGVGKLSVSNSTRGVVQAAGSTVDKYVLIPFAGNDTIMPFSQSKLYPLPFLSLVLNNYLSHLAGAIPEIDGPTETCLLKKAWFPMVLHSKILFQVIVLFSASHYATHQRDQAYEQDILFVKHCALRDLQNTLRVSDGFEKDENIAAVGKLASYEALFGSESAYHVHMNALEQMLKRRGGLSALGMNGFLARLLIFIDTNSAFLLNTNLHLSGSNFPRAEPWMPPNPSKFAGSG